MKKLRNKIRKVIFENIIYKERLKQINNKIDKYSSIIDCEQIESEQVNKFNEIWKYAYTRIPFYSNWKEEFKLPDRINYIYELNDFPVLTKHHIQNNTKLIFDHLEKYNIISTGGSTGQPTKFPVDNKTVLNGYANQYMSRSWWNIKPLDRIFLIWGHSHLFGKGIKGKLNYVKRIFFDKLINTIRLSAYDMSVETINDYYQELKNSDADVIIGYTSTVYKLAKYIEENHLDLDEVKELKGVIVTSETVTDYDIELIERVFKVPCIIEYGMAECGVLAYSKNNTNTMQFLWDTFIGTIDEDDVLHVTTIDGRIFPLINYRTEDIIHTDDASTLLNINKIIGRANDFIKLRRGSNLSEVHSELFTHLLKSIDGVSNFKIIQKKNSFIEIEYVCYQPMDISKYFFQELKKEFDSVDENQFSFKQVDNIPKTLSGKEKWIEIE